MISANFKVMTQLLSASHPTRIVEVHILDKKLEIGRIWLLWFWIVPIEPGNISPKHFKYMDADLDYFRGTIHPLVNAVWRNLMSLAYPVPFPHPF